MLANYIPVYIDNLSTEGFLPFNLYRKSVIGGREKFTPYKNARQSLTPSDKQALLRQGIRILYIRPNDGKRYRPSRRRIQPIVKSASAQLAKKAEETYVDAISTVRNILENPFYGANIKLACQTVGNLVHNIVEHEDILTYLLSITTHDYYTYTHCVHVCIYSLGLAHHLAPGNPETLRTVGIGALLHDVGKSKIDSAILNKPGKLSPNEWQEIRKHPGVNGLKIDN